ncbi:hypothetical protein D3C79_764120 [compost metagenome]
MKGLLAKAGQDEETKLIAEGKLDEVISRRTERLRTDLDKQVKAANERADKAEAFAAKYSDIGLWCGPSRCGYQPGSEPAST